MKHLTWFLEDRAQNYPIIFGLLMIAMTIWYYFSLLVTLKFYEWLVLSDSEIVWWFLGLGQEAFK